ncbi:MAG: hypothetical protein QOG03_649, partial [Actinomycetota bacterium]|nr:hypothetical protein [Actinomycetota bacterium]
TGLDDPIRAALLVGLGDAQRQAGDPVHRQTLLDAAHLADRLGAADLLVRAALANHRGLPSASGAVDEERVAVLELAIEAAGPDDSTARANLLSTLALELTFGRDVSRRTSLAHEAQAMALRLGDDVVVLRVLNTTLMALLVPEALDEVTAMSRQALSLAAKVGDPVARFWAAVGELMVQTYRLDGEAIDAALALMDEMVTEIGQPSLRWLLQSSQSWRAMVAGDADRSEALATEALQLGNDTGQPDAFAMFGGHILAIRWMQGRQSETVSIVTATVADNPGIPAFKGSMAQQLASIGSPDEARRLLADAMGEDFYVDAHDYLWTTTATLFALAAVKVEDVAAAARLWELLEPWADQGLATLATCTGSVNLYLGPLAALLGKSDEAERYFSEADALHRRLPAPFYVGLNNVGCARFLLARDNPGDAERARTLLDEAGDLAERHGFGDIERSVVDLRNP